MEFKGTKGKWAVIRMDDTFIETEDSNVCEIPHNGVYNYEELPYNAQLIAHAPEMLELLEECMDTFNCEDANDRDLKSRVNDLLTRATTI